MHIKDTSKVTFIKSNEDMRGQRVDNLLFRLCKGIPKSHIYCMLRRGEVRINKKRIEPSYRIAVGDNLRLPPLRISNACQSLQPLISSSLTLPVLFEDSYFLAIDKPAGIAVHGGSGINQGVIEQLRYQRSDIRFLELVHRLDRDTSGVLLLAKKRSALLSTHTQFREGKMDKRYLACIIGKWLSSEASFNAPLHKFINSEGERRVIVHQNGKDACTIFRLRERFNGYALVEVEPKTGRTHQIRVHLAHLGFPIAGDNKYGNFQINKNLARKNSHPRLTRMFLHAERLTFTHPYRRVSVNLEAPLPLICQKFVEELRNKSK